MYHAFGTPRNCLKVERIVGRCKILILIWKVRWITISVLVVDGDAPLILGKDMLQKHRALENHEDNRITIRTDEGTVRLTTIMPEIDGHTRIIIGGNSASGNIAESMIQKLNKDCAYVEMTKKNT